MSGMLGFLSRLVAPSRTPEMMDGDGHGDHNQIHEPTVNDQAQVEAVRSAIPQMANTNVGDRAVPGQLHDLTNNDQARVEARPSDNPETSGDHGADHSHDRTINEQPYLETSASDTPKAVNVTLHIPAHIHLVTDIIIKACVDGAKFDRRLIYKGPLSLSEIFTTPLAEKEARVAEFIVIYGKADTPGPGKFMCLKGQPLKLSCPLVSQSTYEEGRVEDNDVPGHSKDGVADLETTPANSALRQVEDESAPENLMDPSLSKPARATGVALNEPEDNSTRSNGLALPLSDEDPDTEMSDVVESNIEQFKANDTTSHREKPMRTSFGIYDDSIDQDVLVSSSKPLELTKHRNSGVALESARSRQLEGSGKINKEAPTTQKDSDIVEDEATGSAAPVLEVAEEPTNQELYPQWYLHSGVSAHLNLLKHLAENDAKIFSYGSPKHWLGTMFGTNADLSAKNIFLRDLAVKQVKLCRLRSTCRDANAAANISRGWQGWTDDKIDEYERQLDSAIAAFEGLLSTSVTVPKMTVNGGSSQDSDNMLPLMSGPQREMADALLSEDQPMRQAAFVDDQRKKNKQAARDADESEERPTKKPRVE